MKKFLLYFPMFSLITPVLKANTGSFLEPLRKEFPEFVQKAQTETPLFIRYMDAKSLTNFQYFKGIALEAVAFSTIQLFIDFILPFCLSRDSENEFILSFWSINKIHFALRFCQV